MPGPMIRRPGIKQQLLSATRRASQSTVLAGKQQRTRARMRAVQKMLLLVSKCLTLRLLHQNPCGSAYGLYCVGCIAGQGPRRFEVTVTIPAHYIFYAASTSSDILSRQLPSKGNKTKRPREKQVKIASHPW